MANEWWNRDPFNNRYAGGENNSLLARDRRDSIVGARAGNPVIWPYNASGVQNRPGAVAAQQGQDVPSAPNTTRTFGNQDTPSAPQGSQTTQPPVTPPTPPTPPAPPFGANVRPSSDMGPAFDPLRPPGTPFAPTAAQVAANPSAYAGTSFDPALRAQFQPNTALANSTTQDTVGSDGQVIRGFQGWTAGASATGNEWMNRAVDPQGRSAAQRIVEQNRLVADLPDVVNLGWLYANENRGTGPQSNTYRDPRFADPLLRTPLTQMTPERYGQVNSLLDSIDPRIRQFYGPSVYRS